MVKVDCPFKKSVASSSNQWRRITQCFAVILIMFYQLLAFEFNTFAHTYRHDNSGMDASRTCTNKLVILLDGCDF